MRTCVPVMACALAVAACGTGDDRREVRAVVAQFYDAIRAGDGETACSQLTQPAVEQLESQSARRCPEAITRLDIGGGAVVGADVFVTNAKADVRGGESAFLSLEPEGWRLSAVGCKPGKGPPQDHPLDCEVEA